MASVYKRGKKWRAEIRRKTGARSRTFDTKLEALRWAEEQEHEMARGSRILYGKTVADAMDRYGREISPTKKGARWEIVRLKKLTRLPWATIQLMDLTTEDLQAWIDDSLNTLSPGTVLRELGLVVSVLEQARLRWKWVNGNPAKDVQRPKRPASRDRRISDTEIDRVLAALGYKADAEKRGCAWEAGHAFLLAIETAMRHGEIFSLDWRDIDLDRRFLKLNATKNNDSREVPLSTRAAALLKMMDGTAGGRVFKTNKASTETMFRRKVKDAGIVDLHFHDTRHEALTRLADKLKILELARAVGHRDLKSLLIYYNATGEELAQKLD